MITRPLRAFWRVVAILLLAELMPALCAEEVTLRDCAGNLCRPLDIKEQKAIVLIFIARECPISNAMAPEINRITAAYTNFAFYLLHADPDTTPEMARQHARDFLLKPPVLLDPEHQLVKVAGASMTPEAVVLDGHRKVLYRGRINDLFAALGKKRPAPTRHDLREALDAIDAGKPVPNAEAKVIGCYIPAANEIRNPKSETIKKFE